MTSTAIGQWQLYVGRNGKNKKRPYSWLRINGDAGNKGHQPQFTVNPHVAEWHQRQW